MNCVYHPANFAHVRCGSCQRGLCPACDHRIKGSPFCQECIVAGIDLLRHRETAQHPPVREKSPNIATVFALIPGLGAAYNGQHIKAMVQFALVVGLWHLADIMPTPFSLIFGLGGVGFFLFTVYDARLSAARLRAGEDLSEDDLRLKQSLRHHAPLWGCVLVGFGVISFLHIFFDTQLYGLWPILLIGAGIYFLRGFRRLSHGGIVQTSYRTSPPSVTSSRYERADGRYAPIELRRSDRRR